MIEFKTFELNQFFLIPVFIELENIEFIIQNPFEFNSS